MTQNRPETQRDYIVCTEAPVVAEDISAGIAEWDPAARVTLCPRSGELAQILAALDGVAVVVTSVPPAELARPDLRNDLMVRGAGVIWLATGKHVETPVTGLRIVPLEVPFTTPALHAALDRVARA
ncbi:hypothetical protein [Rhodosalinus sp.]|uniref:hypothetical protein n=1 Tax=Rhodosalinus sp. TaxID=2047741 RepID=UPI003565574E